MGYEHPSGKNAQDLVGHLGERRGVLDHVVGDVGDSGHDRSDGTFWIHQRVEHRLDPLTLHDHHGDFGNPVVVTRARPGGFDIDHRKGTLLEQRR